MTKWTTHRPSLLVSSIDEQSVERPPRGRIRWLVLLGLGLALMLGLSGCSSSEPVEAVEDVAWGAEATRYFEELSVAHQNHDDYRVLDFHTPVAEVERWWRALRGGGRVSDVLRWNSGDLSQELEQLYLSGNEALTLVTFATEAERAAVVIETAEGLISHETVFDLAESLLTGARRDPIILDDYQRLYDDYLALWSDPEARGAAEMYGPNAIVVDSLFDVQGPPDSMYPPGSDSEAAGRIAPHPDGNLVYLGPSDYGDDPQRAVAVYEVTDELGCAHLMAVRWDLADGLIVGESRYHEVESLRSCATEPLPQGWWTGLDLPGPSDQVITGTIVTPGGRTIDVHNGTERLESLVSEGLSRFAEAGLVEPQFDTLTFEPTRQCESRTGRVIESDGFRELFLCMYESDLCPRAGPCDEPALVARLAVLHELGHAWMIDEVDAATEVEIVNSSGRTTWSDHEVPWNERGVEYAAEILAWGLSEQEVSMVRIGSPSCTEMTSAFVLLTSAVPVRTSGVCPN